MRHFSNKGGAREESGMNAKKEHYSLGTDASEYFCHQGDVEQGIYVTEIELRVKFFW